MGRRVWASHPPRVHFEDASPKSEITNSLTGLLRTAQMWHPLPSDPQTGWGKTQKSQNRKYERPQEEPQRRDSSSTCDVTCTEHNNTTNTSINKYTMLKIRPMGLLLTQLWKCRPCWPSDSCSMFRVNKNTGQNLDLWLFWFYLLSPSLTECQISLGKKVLHTSVKVHWHVCASRCKICVESSVFLLFWLHVLLSFKPFTEVIFAKSVFSCQVVCLQ